jgi:hypothetical protein
VLGFKWTEGAGDKGKSITHISLDPVFRGTVRPQGKEAFVSEEDYKLYALNTASGRKSAQVPLAGRGLQAVKCSIAVAAHDDAKRDAVT